MSVTIDERYLTYNKEEVQAILDKANNEMLYVEPNNDPASLFDDSSSSE